MWRHVDLPVYVPSTHGPHTSTTQAVSLTWPSAADLSSQLIDGRSLIWRSLSPVPDTETLDTGNVACLVLYKLEHVPCSDSVRTPIVSNSRLYIDRLQRACRHLQHADVRRPDQVCVCLVSVGSPKCNLNWKIKTRCRQSSGGQIIWKRDSWEPLAYARTPLGNSYLDTRRNIKSCLRRMHLSSIISSSRWDCYHEGSVGHSK